MTDDDDHWPGIIVLITITMMLLYWKIYGDTQ